MRYTNDAWHTHGHWRHVKTKQTDQAQSGQGRQCFHAEFFSVVCKQVCRGGRLDWIWPCAVQQAHSTVCASAMEGVAIPPPLPHHTFMRRVQPERNRHCQPRVSLCDCGSRSSHQRLRQNHARRIESFGFVTMYR